LQRVVALAGDLASDVPRAGGAPGVGAPTPLPDNGAGGAPPRLSIPSGTVPIRKQPVADTGDAVAGDSQSPNFAQEGAQQTSPRSSRRSRAPGTIITTTAASQVVAAPSSTDSLLSRSAA